jgi:imidazolonepropionase-like amidohydrolase
MLPRTLSQTNYKPILYIHVNETREIVDAVNLAKNNGVKKIVLVGGTSANLIANFIKQNNVTVMIERPHSLPKHTDDDVDAPYKTAKLLYDAGILFCIQNEGDMEAMNCRNLPFLAGTCVAYGLPYEQAVAAITLNTAKIMGIDAVCGSIEVGKDATLFVSDGDALDMKTNNVTNAFIQGKKIELTSVQTSLNNKYKKKYDLK